MQLNQITKWVKSNKLLSAIIVGAIIIAIILYLGANKQVPEAEEQPKEAVIETPGGGVAEAPTGEATAPETAEAPAETIENAPLKEPVET